eukprot:gene1579-32966_t
MPRGPEFSALGLHLRSLGRISKFELQLQPWRAHPACPPLALVALTAWPAWPPENLVALGRPEFYFLPNPFHRLLVDKLDPKDVCGKFGFRSSDSCMGNKTAACLNMCNGRGTCVGGWCHCIPGYYGGDCSLSIGSAGKPEILSGLGYKPSKHGPSIYIYEVPPLFNTWRNIEKFDRPLYSQFWKRIISSGHRTLDAANADYYYIPVDFRYLFKDTFGVLKYVWETWPYWNQTQGARHLLLSTSDLGGCEGKQLMNIRNITSKSTWLTAWGLTRKHPRVWWPGCHRPGIDIVIPIPANTHGMLYTPLNPKATSIQGPSQTLSVLYTPLNPKICGDNKDPRLPTTGGFQQPQPAVDLETPVTGAASKAHASPVCQTTTNPLYSAARPGYKIVPRSASYVTDMSTAQFCLAPTGGGHGKRQVLVSRFGCIPVPICDHVLQPFEPELNWSSFSITVPEADISKIPEILAKVSPEQLKQMQEANACAARHLWWSSMWGGIFGEDGRYDAFATTLEILRVRTEHPGTPPDQYSLVDERWKAFATCSLPGEESDSSKLCSYSGDKDLEHVAPTGFCQVTSVYGKYGIPGGAICQGYPDLANCPRPGE